jgi:hypothetical protein
MGMDLIGFLVIGPSEIDRHAVNRMRKVLKEDLKVLNSLGPDDDLADVTLHFKDDSGMSDREITLFKVQSAIDTDFPKTFAKFWNDGCCARDAASRLSPDGDLIVFAGGGSWGDEPDGEGYEMLRDAHDLGLFEPAGIY